MNPDRIQEALDQGYVAVIAGFMGTTREGEITTLGRGGSDTTAVAMAAALGAKECEIYTDTEGVYTTDPHLIPEARKLEVIGYDQMLEMAALGARVLHLGRCTTPSATGWCFTCAPASPITLVPW